MRLRVRQDLGGFAASLPVLAAIGEQDITKPFVLLCGPNGSGKTALLHMIRSTIGLQGGRLGHLANTGEYERPANLEECGGDLGKMAAYQSGGHKDGVPRDLAGVLDVHELGWTGQRTWLFDSRRETSLVSSSSFDDDMAHHVSVLTSGASRSSHGQVLRNSWADALMFASGTMTEVRDPYDGMRLPAARCELWNQITAGSPTRPAERWLLLDEPEVALDAEALMMGLSLLVRGAGLGRLRVFCASHSPLFTAGLADDPNVQVLDLGGPQPWLRTQQAALQVAADPARVSLLAARSLEIFQSLAAKEATERAQAFQKKVDAALMGLKPHVHELLVAALEEHGLRLPGATQAGKKLTALAIENLDERGLVRTRGNFKKPEAFLTPLGVDAARRLSPNSPALGLASTRDLEDDDRDQDEGEDLGAVLRAL